MSRVNSNDAFQIVYSCIHCACMPFKALIDRIIESNKLFCFRGMHIESCGYFTRAANFAHAYSRGKLVQAYSNRVTQKHTLQRMTHC